MALTAQQKTFCEHYAACGNGAEAARRAGYSPRSARAQAARLLTNDDIKAYLHQLQKDAEERRIASVEEVKGVWSEVLRDPQQKTAQRLRAGELLMKTAGEMSPSSPRSPASADFGGVDFEPPEPGEESVVVLPYNGRDPATFINAVMFPGGRVVPLQGHESDDVLIFLDADPYSTTSPTKEEPE